MRVAARSLVLALPSRCEGGTTATEKWLLSLWQAASKSTWSVWRGIAAISLEYFARDSLVQFQVHHASRLLADISGALLPVVFPGLELERRGQDSLDFVQEGAGAAVMTFGLRSPGWIDFPKDEEPDAVDGITHALARASRNGAALVQLLLDPTWMTTEEGRQPAFWLAGRVVATSGNEHDAERRARLVASTFGQLAGFNGLRFRSPHPLLSSDTSAIHDRRAIRRFLPSGSPVTASQVARLYHPPAEPYRFAIVHTSPCLRTPTLRSGAGISIGEGRDVEGQPATVRLQPSELLRHGFVIGPSGSGKTTLLANMAHELARAGHGVTVIDPHGALVRHIARTLAPERQGDASLISFADIEHPVALNPLRVRPGQEFVAADELVEVVERVYGREYWGPLIDLILRHAAMAAIELGGSLIESARLLDDAWFREQALAKIANPETARVLSQLGTGASYDRRILPAINRLQRLLATPWLRNIVGQRGRGIDFVQLFERREIALFDLSGIGTTNAKLLGSLLLLLIRQATLGRGAGERSPRHFVLVDEASWFVSRTIAELFDQARKFGVGVVLAIQRVGQLTPEDTREAVLSNAGTVLTFRINDRDEATFLSRHLASERIGLHDLQHLPPYEAYVQVTSGAQRVEPAWLRMSPPHKEPANASAVEMRLLESARQRYSHPRDLVEAELHARDHALVEDAEPEIRQLAAQQVTVLAHAQGPVGP